MESLEEQFAKHPYSAECICKLCDWRREPDWDEPLGGKLDQDRKDPRLPDPDRVPESFRDFHNEMRKYRRRVFVREDTGTATRSQPKVKGKGLKRALKKMKVASLKEGGHGKGDNRKVIWRDTAVDTETANA